MKMPVTMTHVGERLRDLRVDMRASIDAIRQRIVAVGSHMRHGTRTETTAKDDRARPH